MIMTVQYISIYRGMLKQKEKGENREQRISTKPGDTRFTIK